MADYTQNTTFATKDALNTGDAEKIILGADFDAEFVEIAARSADKEDISNKAQPNGYAGLDASTLLTAAQIPVATATAKGGAETATTAEARALSLDTKIITPSGLNDVLSSNDAVLSDLVALSSQSADSVYGWDTSASAAIGFAPAEGVQIVTTSLKLDFLGLAAATIVAADTVAFYDATDSTHKKALFSAFEAALTAENLINGVDMSTITVTAGEGLAYSVGGTNLAADSTMDLDITNLTALAGTDVAATDEFVVWDATASAHKKVQYQSAGVPIIAKTASATLTDAEMNSFFICEHASVPIVLSINTGVGEKGNVVIVQQSGAAQASLAGTATFNSVLGEKCAAEDSVIIAVCTATNVWTVYGDHAA